MHGPMAGFIIQTLDHIKTELILNVKMATPGYRSCGREIDGIGSFADKSGRQSDHPMMAS